MGSGIPIVNWDFEGWQRQERAERLARNAKAEGSKSDANAPGFHPVGVNPMHAETQYRERSLKRVPDGPGRSQSLAEMLSDMLEDEDDPDVQAIKRIVQRRIAGDTTPSSVYGGPGQPSYNTARDLLALNYAPSSVEYLSDVFPQGARLTEAQRHDTMPVANWDYEAWSQEKDHERPRV